MLSHKILTTGILTIGLVIFAGSGYAQMSDWCPMHRGHWNDWSGRNVPEKYRLSEDQQAKTNQIHAKFDEKLLPLRKELSAKRLELMAYISRDDASPEKIKAYRKEIRDLQDKIDDLRLDAKAEINQVFTKEQQAYFGNRYDFWEMGHGHDGFCPMMNEDWSGDSGMMMERGGCW